MRSIHRCFCRWSAAGRNPSGAASGMQRSSSRNHLKRSNGQALILVILTLPLFFSMCAVVVDGTSLMVNKRQMQNAADAAALAAGQELGLAVAALGECAPGASACRVAVQDNAAVYTPVADAATDYVAKNWHGGTPPTLTRCASVDDTNCWSWPYQKGIYGVDPGYDDTAYHYVQVRLKRPVTGFFASIAGVADLFAVGARAVAAALPETSVNTSTNMSTTPGTVNTITGPGGTSTITTPGSTVTTTAPTFWDASYNGDEPHVTANTGCGFPGIEFNNEVLNAPFISRGNVCLRGNAPGGQLLAGGANGQIEIEGLLGLVTSANRVAAVQGGTTPIFAAQIGLGCRIGGVTTVPCTSAQRVYATTIGTTPVNLTRPTFNWLSEYTKAAPGPLHPCDPTLLNAGESAGTPPTFDNNTTYNASVSTADPTTAGSYICRARDASGNIGELSWDAAQKKLTISGVVFFDAARFTLSGSSLISGPIHYYGQGTIFVASNSQGLFGETWCAGGTLGVDCASPISNLPNWDPSQNALWLVLGGGATTANGGNGPTVGNGNNDIDYKAPSAFQGVIYTVNSCHIHGAGAYLSGPLICGLMDTAGLGASAMQFPPVRQLEGGGTTTTTVTPGTTTVTSTPGTTTVFTTPGSTSTIVSTSTLVTGTTLGLDE